MPAQGFAGTRTGCHTGVAVTAGELQACLDGKVETISPETPLAEIVRRMDRTGQSALVVTDADRRPVGILTERDILRAYARELRGEAVRGCTARDLMTPDPVTLSLEDRLYDALVISQSHRIRHLPVVDDRGRLVGMVTHPCLINAHLRLIDEQSERLERAVARETEHLARTNRELLTLSLTDALLGIGNRRAMEVDLRHSLMLAQAHGHPLTAMLIDIDHFKLYNDHHGHLAGDEALKQAVARIRSAIRSADRLYRYGGEEFLLLLPGCDARQARQVGVRILEAFARDPVPHAAVPLQRLSVSIGIAALPANGEVSLTPEAFLEAADRRLYAAKAAGRNRLCGPGDEMQAA